VCFSALHALVASKITLFVPFIPRKITLFAQIYAVVLFELNKFSSCGVVISCCGAKFMRLREY
jgi:hypothetical protein